MIYVYVAAIFLGVWLVATVFAQINQTATFLRVDLFGLIPNCRFFAPKPVSHDLMVYVRSIDEKGVKSHWRPLIDDRKTPWCFVWNPQHRLRKAIHDFTEAMQREEGNSESWHLSYPYLVMLDVATAKCSTLPSVKWVQFVIAASTGFDNETPNLLFVSHTHNC
jgi:hypothetical protein